MEKENEVIENLFEEITEEKMVSEEKVEESLSEFTPEIENNAFADLPPVAPVNYEEEVVENPVESPVEATDVEEKTEEETVENVEVNPENLNKEVLEHPDAKIKLNNEQEEELDKKEIDELKDIKLMDNSSLRFVLILGAILLVAVFLIPVISEYI